MTDVLLVSLGSTAGLRAADDELAASLERAGAEVARARASARLRELPTLVLTDFAQAAAARGAARRAIAAHAPRAIIYSTMTAALLWPRPGAIRFDSLAASNRPGRHGLWQRPLERRRLAQATLELPWSERAGAGHRPRGGDSGGPRVVVPVPVERSGPPAPRRDIAAITYAAHPHKKGLDRVLAAWDLARAEGEELLVAGALPAGFALPAGSRALGALERAAYRALLRRTRVFVCAPRREDHGIAQLEALADGCLLVSMRAPGPYVALELARELDGRLVVAGEDDPRALARALRMALDDPRPGYGDDAARKLAPFSRAAADELVAERVLPLLLKR